MNLKIHLEYVIWIRLPILIKVSAKQESIFRPKTFSEFVAAAMLTQVDV